MTDKNKNFYYEKKMYPYFQENFLKGLLNFEFEKDWAFEDSKYTLKGVVEYTIKDDSNEAILLIELKGQKANLDKPQRNYGNKTPVQQAYDYALNSNANWYIAFNYDELRIYNKFESYLKENYISFKFSEIDEDDLIVLILLLSKEYFQQKRILDEIKKETLIIEAKITDQIYKLYHENRLILIRQLQNNNKLNFLDAVRFAQLILNRVMFICFAEDKALLPNQIFEKTLSKPIVDKIIKINRYSIWREINHLFEDINEGHKTRNIPEYNGGLFEEDLSFLKISDLYNNDKEFRDLFQDHKIEHPSVKKIVKAYQNSTTGFINPIFYNFLLLASFDYNTEIDVKIMGHIFEQSITDLEELKKGLDKKARKENIRGKRKSEGIYYTPETITDYICRNTIIPYLSKNNVKTPEKLLEEYDENEIKELERKLSEIKILDMSCGSGAFLNKAVDILMEIHKLIYIIKQEFTKTSKDKKTKKEIKLFLIDKYFDSIEQRKKIILNNVFGVDINEQSIEISKLSLFLEIASTKEKLPDLSNNFKNGNSLIDNEDKTIDENEVKDFKVFNWNQEFKQIMDKEGFDIIIGNPPYINAIIMKAHFSNQRSYLKKNYSYLVEKWDIYIAFIERALGRLLKPNGYMSYIIPDAFLTEKYALKIQDHIKNNLRVIEIVYFPNTYLFKGVRVHNIILTVQNAPPKFPILKKSFEKGKKKPFEKEVENVDDIFSGFQSEMIKLNEDLLIYLGDVCYISKGMVLHSKAPQFKGLFKKDDVISDIEINEYKKRIIFGENVFPFEIDGFKFLEWNTDRVPAKVSRPTFPKLHQKYKLISNKLGKLKIAFDDYGYMCDQTVRVLIKWNQIKGIKNKSINNSIKKYSNYPRDKLEQISEPYDYHFLLGILNSNFIQFYFDMLRGESSFDINPLILRKIPLPKIEKLEERKEIIEITKKILGYIKEKTKIQQKFLKLIKSDFKIKISKKLESWDDIEFDTFLKELKRFTTLSLKQKSEWMDFFDEKKKEITKIKKMIKDADKKLNSFIFQLYQLNINQIKKVEDYFKIKLKI